MLLTPCSWQSTKCVQTCIRFLHSDSYGGVTVIFCFLRYWIGLVEGPRYVVIGSFYRAIWPGIARALHFDVPVD